MGSLHHIEVWLQIEAWLQNNMKHKPRAVCTCKVGGILHLKDTTKVLCVSKSLQHKTWNFVLRSQHWHWQKHAKVLSLWNLGRLDQWMPLFWMGTSFVHFLVKRHFNMGRESYRCGLVECWVVVFCGICPHTQKNAGSERRERDALTSMCGSRILGTVAQISILQHWPNGP